MSAQRKPVWRQKPEMSRPTPLKKTKESQNVNVTGRKKSQVSESEVGKPRYCKFIPKRCQLKLTLSESFQFQIYNINWSSEAVVGQAMR